MKTKTLTLKQSSYLIALFFMLFSLSSLKAQAPACSYSVVNPGPCTILVDVDYYDNTNTLCLSLTNQSIGAFTRQLFSCASCNQPLSNIRVTLISINGNPPSGGNGFVDINNTNDSGNISNGTCNPVTYNYTIDWFFNETIFGY